MTEKIRWFLTCFVFLFLHNMVSATEFGDPARFAIRFHETTGNLSSIIYKGETLTAFKEPGTKRYSAQSSDTPQNSPDTSVDPTPQRFDILQDTEWAFGKGKLELVEIKKESDSVVIVTQKIGDWTVAFRYTVDVPMATLGRDVELVYNGKAPTKIKSFWMALPVFPFEKDAEFFVPGVYPPKKFTPDNFAEGAKQGIWKNSSPFVFQLDKTKSLILLSDQLESFADRPGGDASRRDGGLRLVQSFDTKGHVKPGEEGRQRIGTGYMRIVDGDSETALLKIHDLMRQFGQTVPKDRPQWFESAIAYSFHPGGTIGSGCKDLGGFVPATQFLDRIKEIGCNTIWFLPLEDKSIYWPRDYYKFQDGLGTPEEFQTLVNRAHELDMKVLMDSVPHGGSNTYQRMIDHPEWLAQNEDGSTLHYWCADFNWPEWIKYMADVSRYYVKTYGIDGFRIDACGGSKIPNWNPAIPYARASHSQSQGGLNMVRAIRQAVKDENPDGATLAEVNGGLFGAVSDAVYDFDLCYNVLHDARKQTPEEFVKRIRRWLHEQQYSETPDLLRLRHVESHDSLRGQLWYGTEPHRAMMALTAFIHGMPLIYHEQDTGHLIEFQEMFGYRQNLPELNGGDADYLCVDAPPGVFACLRTKNENSSVVLINFNDVETTGPVSIKGKDLKFDVTLEPFAYKIASIRDDKTEWRNSGKTKPKRFGDKESKESAPTTNSEAATQFASGSLVVPMWNFTLRIDPKTGLLTSLEKNGVVQWGAAELFLPPGFAEKAQKPIITKRPLTGVVKEDVIVRQSFGDAELKIEYAAEEGVHIRCSWTGKNLPNDFAMSIPVVDATHWTLNTFEGRLADWYAPRHLTTDGVHGSIYWRPQGTNVLADSLLNPVESVQFGSMRTRKTQGVWFHEPNNIRFRLLDRIGDAKFPTMLFSSADGKKPGFSISLDSIAKQDTRPKNLRPTAGGWSYENNHYKLRLTRSGTIMSLDKKRDGDVKSPQGRNDPLIYQGDIYTDYGYGAEKMRYAAANDVEAGCRIIQDGNVVRLRFEGQLRGFGRFDLLRPPIEYFAEYALNDGPAITFSYGIKPHRAANDSGAFLAAIFPMPNVERFEYFKDGKILAEGTNVDAKGRSFEARGVLPQRAVLKDSQGDVLFELVDLKGEASNLFLDRKNFFVCFDDRNSVASPHRWRSFSTTLYCDKSDTKRDGDVKSPQRAVDSIPENTGNTVPGSSNNSLTEENNMLFDGGFEAASSGDLVSLQTGTVLMGEKRRSFWQTPPFGTISTEEFHTDNASARVDGETAQYRLFTQDVQTDKLKPGQKLKLSAWAKGKDLKTGPEGWQTACVRFVAIVDGKTQYVAGSALTGSFDWKETSAEFIVPEKLQRLSVQVGSNGAAGTVWIDDVQLIKRDGDVKSP